MYLKEPIKCSKYYKYTKLLKLKSQNFTHNFDLLFEYLKSHYFEWKSGQNSCTKIPSRNISIC